MSIVQALGIKATLWRTLWQTNMPNQLARALCWPMLIIHSKIGFNSETFPSTAVYELFWVLFRMLSSLSVRRRWTSLRFLMGKFGEPLYIGPSVYLPVYGTNSHSMKRCNGTPFLNLFWNSNSSDAISLCVWKIAIVCVDLSQSSEAEVQMSVLLKRLASEDSPTDSPSSFGLFLAL